jgi:hypothetical protein
MSADTRRRPVAPDTLEAEIVIEQRGHFARTPPWSMRPGVLICLPICVECLQEIGAGRGA